MKRSTAIVHLPKRALAEREISARLEEALGQLWASLESPESRIGYKGDWGRYLTWLELEGVSVLEARPMHVQKYILHMRERKLARKTRARALSVIREVYAAFCRADLVVMNPAREVKNPRVDRGPRTPWLDEGGLQKLLDALWPADSTDWYERRDRMCVLLLVGLAKRRSEVARIRVRDFRDSIRALWGIVKRSKEEIVGVPPWLDEETKEWIHFAGLKATDPLLPYEPAATEPISKYMVHNIVRRAAKRAGVSITPHGLRRTYITVLGQMGVDLKKRQLAVSHENIATTGLYDKAREAAENAPGQMFAELVHRAKGKAL